MSTIARYDKYEPKAGGFRAPLAANFASGNLSTVKGVGLDSSGKIVIGAGNTGIIAVLVLTKVRNAGDIVDNMTDGEIVEFPGAAGTKYYSAADGTISTTNTGTYVGSTVEASRLVVRVAR